MLIKLFFAFFKIGAFSFGGGYAMIPLIQKEIVEKYGFMTMRQFGDIIAIAEMTPGPISVNCATFVGYNVGGIFGAFFATLGVVAPSLLVVLILASIFLNYHENKWVLRVFIGIRPVVVALIFSAAIGLSKIAVIDWKSAAITLVVFQILRFRRIHPALVVLMAGGLGVILYGM